MGAAGELPEKGGGGEERLYIVEGVVDLYREGDIQGGTMDAENIDKTEREIMVRDDHRVGARLKLGLEGVGRWAGKRGRGRRPHAQVIEGGDSDGEKRVPKKRADKFEKVTEEEFLSRVTQIVQWIWELYPQNIHDNLRVSGLVIEAYHVADENFGISEAVAWADGFVWPPDISHRDEERLRLANGNLSLAVCGIRDTHRDDRLSHKRISDWIADTDDDAARLHDLADGMRVFLDENFRPNQEPPPLRSMYLRAAPAVNKLLLEWWEEDLAMIVKTDTLRSLPEVHFSPAHWTTKAGKREGRVLFDSSDDSKNPCLNSESAREQLRTHYGDIVHPTLDDFVLMILDVEDDHPQSLHELCLWKWDLRKAFTLLDFRTQDCRLLACELTGDLSLIYHTGLFGWTGTPFAFQVVSRALHRELLRRGVRQLVYVDDIGGICEKGAVGQQRSVVRAVAEGLLGPKALAMNKWETGRRVDYIGWEIDLDNRRVTLKRRNFLKVLHGFFAVDLDKPWSGRIVERLASWASRYTTVLRHLRPFTDDLYGELRQWKKRDATRVIGRRARRAILMWRVVLCAASLQEEQIARPLDSFRRQAADITIAYDASLSGVGVGIERISGELLTVYRAQFPFNLESDASFQNTAEFIAVVMGCGLLATLGLRGARIHLKGDSMTSLVWSSTEKFKSEYCTSAAVSYVLIAMECDFQVVSTQHVRGEDNIFYDALSRGYEELYCHDLPWTVAQSTLDELLGYCNPNIDLLDPALVAPVWQGVKAWITRVVNGA